MVDRIAEVWTIKLAQHKTAHRGKTRVLYVGPEAQAVLAPYLLGAANANCFSPQENERQRLDAKHEAWVTPANCGKLLAVAVEDGPLTTFDLAIGVVSREFKLNPFSIAWAAD